MNFTHKIILIVTLTFTIYCTSPQEPINTNATLKQSTEKEKIYKIAPQTIHGIPLPLGFYRTNESGEMTDF